MIRLVLTHLLALTGVACADGPRLDGYDFDAEPAQRWKLPKVLKEISGLAMTPDNRLLAHDDERGIVYQLDPADAKIVKRFALTPTTSADFEGIAATPQAVYLLISDGRIVKTQEGDDGQRVAFKTWRTPVVGACDFEGLVAAPDGTLIIGCKTPRQSGHRSATLFVLDPAANTGTRIEINSERELRLTAIEYDASTGHLLVLSSKKRRIVELTRDGDIVASHKLDKDRHRQPEGLALADDGTLYISDEAGNGKAHLAAYRPRS